MSKRNILVPHDFTSAGETALKYAISLAKIFEAEINLLHITKDTKHNKKAKEKFAKIIESLKLTASDPNVNVIVKKGDIFDDIAGVGKELLSSIIVMGTHGAKGMQRVFGSFAIKVITSTHIPFIIVQDGTVYNTTKEIVFPIDNTKESLQIEQVVSAISKKANSNIHVICEKYSDTSLKIKSAVHYDIINKQFQSLDINYSNEFVKKMSSDAILNYAKKNNCDLVAVAYYSDAVFTAFDRTFQDLIVNKSKLPVLIINSKDVGNYFF